LTCWDFKSPKNRQGSACILEGKKKKTHHVFSPPTPNFSPEKRISKKKKKEKKKEKESVLTNQALQRQCSATKGKLKNRRWSILSFFPFEPCKNSGARAGGKKKKKEGTSTEATSSKLPPFKKGGREKKKVRTVNIRIRRPCASTPPQNWGRVIVNNQSQSTAHLPPIEEGKTQVSASQKPIGRLQPWAPPARGKGGKRKEKNTPHRGLVRATKSSTIERGRGGTTGKREKKGGWKKGQDITSPSYLHLPSQPHITEKGKKEKGTTTKASQKASRK